MKIFVRRHTEDGERKIFLQTERLEFSDGITASIRRDIGSGWKVFGKTYEEWLAYPNGAHEVPDTDPDDDYAPEHLRFY